MNKGSHALQEQRSFPRSGSVPSAPRPNGASAPGPDPQDPPRANGASQSSEHVHAEPARKQLDSGGSHLGPHLEDEFFARGDDIGTLRPAALDTPEIELFETVRRISPRVLARRARLRRVVAGIVGTAAALTIMIVGAKAWTARKPAVSASGDSLQVQSRVVPSIAVEAAEDTTPAVAATAEPSAVANTDQSDPPEAPPAEAQAHHRLPVVDIEIPAPPDVATDRAWETAAQSLSAQDFRGADKAFAELGRRTDPATRETARLARAIWWRANGKQAEVRPVIADLAANAITPAVQRYARDLLLAN